jgi:hypothetical protein
LCRLLTCPVRKREKRRNWRAEGQGRRDKLITDREVGRPQELSGGRLRLAVDNHVLLLWAHDPVFWHASASVRLTFEYHVVVRVGGREDLHQEQRDRLDVLLEDQRTIFGLQHQDVGLYRIASRHEEANRGIEGDAETGCVDLGIEEPLGVSAH